MAERNGNGGIPTWALGLITSLLMLLVGGAWADLRAGLAELRTQQRSDSAKLEKAVGQIDWLREEVRELRADGRRP